MSLKDEIEDIRALVSHWAHHGLPKSESDATAQVEGIQPKQEEDKSESKDSGSGSSSRGKST